MKLNAVLLIVLEVDDLESLLTKRVRPLTGETLPESQGFLPVQSSRFDHRGLSLSHIQYLHKQVTHQEPKGETRG